MQDACSQLFQSNLEGLILAVKKNGEGRGRGLALEKPVALPVLGSPLCTFPNTLTEVCNRHAQMLS